MNMNIAGTYLFKMDDPNVNPPSVRVGVVTLGADGKGTAAYAYYPGDSQPVQADLPDANGCGRIQFHGHQDVEKFPDMDFCYAFNGSVFVGQNMPGTDNAVLRMEKSA